MYMYMCTSLTCTWLCKLSIFIVYRLLVLVLLSQFLLMNQYKRYMIEEERKEKEEAVLVHYPSHH